MFHFSQGSEVQSFDVSITRFLVSLWSAWRHQGSRHQEGEDLPGGVADPAGGGRFVVYSKRSNANTVNILRGSIKFRIY